MKKHIVFDIDGTILDTTEPLVISMQAALASVGRHYDTEDLKIYMGITGMDTMKRLNVENGEEVLHLWEELLKEESWRIKVYDGIGEVIAALLEKGYSLGLVTSKSREELTEDWPRIPFADRFSTVVCASDTAEHKPNPAPLLKYLEKAGISPEDALYIGDSEYDMCCANGAGVDFMLAGWGAINRDLPVETVLEHPADLLQYV